MTLPYERLFAIQNTRRFLEDLIDNQKTPRVPMDIRKRALRILKHYPYDSTLQKEIDLAYEGPIGKNSLYKDKE